MGVDSKNVPGGLVPADEGVALAEKEVLQAVQVALNIRPLIAFERVQGCKDCITVVPGEPQVTFILSSESLCLSMSML